MRNGITIKNKFRIFEVFGMVNVVNMSKGDIKYLIKMIEDNKMFYVKDGNKLIREHTKG